MFIGFLPNLTFNFENILYNKYHCCYYYFQNILTPQKCFVLDQLHKISLSSTPGSLLLNLELP